MKPTSWLLADGVLTLALASIAFATQIPLARATVPAAAAVAVQLDTATSSKHVTTSASTVGAFLAAQGVSLGRYDEVRPSLRSRIEPNEIVRVVHVQRWTAIVRHLLAPNVIRRFSFSLAPGKTRVVEPGRSGERDVVVRYSERDFGKVRKRVITSRLVRKPHARIVEEGPGANGAIAMVATAYTAGCYGCSGYTAIGRRAGHGIVAVDPRVIPLGTKLYIPGYGIAIAGDTGGAIVGRRIDLGFDSMREALDFGRRPITVYRLR